MTQKKKLTLIELHGHTEVLRSFIYALRDFQLTIFAIQNLQEIPSGDSILISPLHEQSIIDFITEHQAIINQSDWIIFITLETHFRFFASQKWKAKTILLIHNGNYWLDYQRNVSLNNIKNVFRGIRAIVFGEEHYRRNIINSFDFITFPNPLIQKHFIERKLVQANKVFPCLSFTSGTDLGQAEKLPEKLVVVIPGAMREETRDYFPVVNAFRNVISLLERPVQMVLLGNPRNKYGLKIQRLFKSLACENFSVVYFAGHISQKMYEDWLAKADFLILPLKKEMRYGECMEIGGLTKISGSVNDMERFAKPSLITKGYHLDPRLSNLVQVYDNADDLGSKLKEWINKGIPDCSDFQSTEDIDWRKHFEAD